MNSTCKHWHVCMQRWRLLGWCTKPEKCEGCTADRGSTAMLSKPSSPAWKSWESPSADDVKWERVPSSLTGIKVSAGIIQTSAVVVFHTLSASFFKSENCLFLLKISSVCLSWAIKHCCHRILLEDSICCFSLLHLPSLVWLFHIQEESKMPVTGKCLFSWRCFCSGMIPPNWEDVVGACAGCRTSSGNYMFCHVTM